MSSSSRPVLTGLVAVLLAVSTLTACGGDDTTRPPTAEGTAPATASAATPATATARPCEHLSRTTASMELHDEGEDVSLWGLLLSSLPVHVGDEVKIVWRITGSGPARFRAISPQGTAAPLAWGPEPHGGSNYRRPGQEFGVGYRFPSPGCWQLHAEREEGAADAWLYVAA